MVAQTTTQINACDIGIWIDDGSGDPKDVSGSTNSASLTLTQNTGEMRTFASDWPARKACGKDAKIALTILYSSASDEGMDIFKDWYFNSSKTARTVSLYIPDKNVGSDHYYGEFLIDGDADIPVEAGQAEPIAVSVNLVVTGELTNTTATT